MKILIIEDEPKVASFLNQGLEDSGYETDLAYDGQMGKKLFIANHYDIVVMDVIIPYINGIDLCQQMKDMKPNTPVLLLTALGTTEDKISGFDAGADDYLVKPFEFRELVARVKALTKRQSGTIESSNKIKVADLELDLHKKLAIRAGKTIELTPREFDMLEYFMRNKGRVLSRVDIAEKVWDINFDTGTNTVDVYINMLRKKIDRDFEPKLIHTRIGMGYIFQES
jgi:DNA-binding response OmpR family regulator